MAAIYRVHEGRRFSPEMWAAVSEWRRLARTEGIPFRITQGGFNNGAVAASGGTHDGDAVDVSVSGLTKAQVARMIELGRMVGIFASFRTTGKAKWGTRAQGFGSYHVHAVPNGWGYPSAGARRQVAHIDGKGVKRGYRHGRDGLASNGTDTGPGHVSTYRTRTWPEYQALKSSPVLSAPPTTAGGLTMSSSQFDTLNDKLNSVLATLSGPNGTNAKLAHIGELTGGRDAIDARNADIAKIVKAATDAQSRVLLDGMGKLGVSTPDLNALKAEVRKAVADAMDGATLEITARHGEEV